jgi:hypothetical protein
MRNIGVDEADFGSGTPARRTLLCRPPWSTCRGTGMIDDGVNVVARCVREDHVDALLGELARLK